MELVCTGVQPAMLRTTPSPCDASARGSRGRGTRSGKQKQSRFRVSCGQWEPWTASLERLSDLHGCRATMDVAMRRIPTHRQSVSAVLQSEAEIARRRRISLACPQN